MFAVAESIALGLRRSTGDIYLDAQIFTGCMFIGASVCTFFLRSWKIGQNEKEANAKREHERGDRQSRPSLLERRHSAHSDKMILRRLFQVKAV